MKAVALAAFVLYAIGLIYAAVSLRPASCAPGDHGLRIGHVLVIGGCR